MMIEVVVRDEDKENEHFASVVISEEAMGLMCEEAQKEALYQSFTTAYKQLTGRNWQ